MFSPNILYFDQVYTKILVKRILDTKKTMSQKVVAHGGNGGRAWNDGIFDGVKKVIVGRDDYCVTFVKFKYVKDSTAETHEHGVINETPQEVTILHSSRLYVTD